MSTVPTVDVTFIGISPSSGPFDAPLTLTLGFSLDAPIASASWQVRYMVDMAHKRHLLELARWPAEGAAALAYGAEAGQSVTIEVPELQLGDLKDKPSVLANAGLLLATLYDGEEEVIQISMLTQVEKAGEALVRTIFSPLDQ